MLSKNLEWQCSKPICPQRRPHLVARHLDTPRRLPYEVYLALFYAVNIQYRRLDPAKYHLV